MSRTEAGNPDLIITIWMVTIWKLFKWWLVSGMKVSQNLFRFESFSYGDWLEVWKLFRLKQEISDIQMVTHKWSENIFRWWHVSNQCTLEITIAYLLISFFVTIVNKSWLGIIWPKTNLKQAGLSRATLEISSGFSYISPLELISHNPYISNCWDIPLLIFRGILPPEVFLIWKINTI